MRWMWLWGEEEGGGGVGARYHAPSLREATAVRTTRYSGDQEWSPSPRPAIGRAVIPDRHVAGAAAA
jgi:hypothetical protein